tara:strand:- start:146 stop:463 length:318 start_codon:yes stop_codon:yes gene_type:complete
MVEPGARAYWSLENSDGYVEGEIVVFGLVCNSICAKRVRQALKELPGVTNVGFHPEKDTFRVTAPVEIAKSLAFDNIIKRQVIGLWARRLLATIARSLKAKHIVN